jgi:3-phenylpropionate/cinnamic acid dioxygenase small subunit
MNRPHDNLATQEPQSTPQYRHEPSSLYMNPAFYDWLRDASADLAAPVMRDCPASDSDWHRVSRLLGAEARLLDQRAFDVWLDMFDGECAYWIPSASPAPDPRNAITLEFHDRRRLLDRIARLGTGIAYSQWPASSTARQWSGLEIWSSPLRAGDWHVRCNFTLAESRNGHNRMLAGWNGFVLRESDAGLRIVVKQVNLIDCDRPQGNNSFFL